MNSPDFRYLTRAEAANYVSARGIPLAKGTLSVMATKGGGPTYRIFGRQSLYSPADLDSWISERMSEPRRSTSEVS
jgi:hypothetical protein